MTKRALPFEACNVSIIKFTAPVIRFASRKTINPCLFTALKIGGLFTSSASDDSFCFPLSWNANHEKNKIVTLCEIVHRQKVTLVLRRDGGMPRNDVNIKCMTHPKVITWSSLLPCLNPVLSPLLQAQRQ